MIPVVMEPRCLDTNAWQGVVGGKLGSKFYCNLTADDDTEFNNGLDSIVEALKAVGVAPGQSQARITLLEKNVDKGIELQHNDVRDDVDVELA